MALAAGIDIGSTTTKVVLMDSRGIVAQQAAGAAVIALRTLREHGPGKGLSEADILIE